MHSQPRLTYHQLMLLPNPADKLISQSIDQSINLSSIVLLLKENNGVKIRHRQQSYPHVLLNCLSIPLCQGLQDFSHEKPFNAIVSSPPYSACYCTQKLQLATAATSMTD